LGKRVGGGRFEKKHRRTFRGQHFKWKKWGGGEGGGKGGGVGEREGRFEEYKKVSVKQKENGGVPVRGPSQGIEARLEPHALLNHGGKKECLRLWET